MSGERQRLEQEAARLWRARSDAAVLRPSAFAQRRQAPSEPGPAKRRDAQTLDFSLMFFSAAAAETARPDLYRLVQEAARFADERGFKAVWMPERHFHAFGGPYPNPAVLAASLAPATRSLRLRAGSVVAPLHHPLEIAEAWSMVDNLSGGRVEIAFGSGWNPNDFVLSPGTYADAKQVFRQRIDEVRRLWRGEALPLPNGRGEPIATRIFPQPLQPELPVWVSATGHADTFRWAGANGFNVLTMLLGGDLDAVAPKIELYRAARAGAGLDPAGGTVALMLHSFVHRDGAFARAAVRAPFMDYVRSAVDTQRQGSDEGRAMSAEQREQVVAYAFERYTRSAALFGSPDECRPMLDRVAAAGVDEVACLIDFGVDESQVLAALEHLDALRGGASRPAPARTAPPERSAPAAAAQAVAIVGMSGRFPGSPDLAAFWQNLCAGRDLLSEPPPDRKGVAAPRGGCLPDIDGFDAALFGIAPAEAAAMDPHQRVFIELVRAAIEDAGYRPGDLRGSDTAVFAAAYSTGHEANIRARGTGLDALDLAGTVLSMVPNRVSFLFDWTGPSELVNTACSSSLVAVHRAVAALRAGECGVAVAGGVSLLLSADESAALARLGVLSPSGACRPFDASADGQVRGEGAGVVVLKRLADAQRDGDFVYAVIRGSAVNHAGGRSNSLTLPNPRLQAACVVDAVRRGGVDARRLGYIEAHGAGTSVGDLAELSAFSQAFETLLGADRRPESACLIGSVKSNIGSLDAAGGIAALIKTALALHHRIIPASINRERDPDGFEAGPFGFADRTEPWPAPATDGLRCAGVHAYGLGGTNAHLVLEEYRDGRPVHAGDATQAIVVTGRTEQALRGNLQRLLAFLDGHRATADGVALSDIAHTLRVGREPLPCRWSGSVGDLDDLRRALQDALASGRPLACTSAMVQERGAAENEAAGRRIPLPAYAYDRPVPAAAHVEPDSSVVGDFYDFVTRADAIGDREIYLTLAPLPEPVAGFSWTRAFQHPDRWPEHWSLLQAAQRQMRDVMFAAVDFPAVDRMLDFGCGLGTDLIALARRHPHLHGAGCTISPRQAELARARVASAGLQARLSVHRQDSAKDPFPGTFELAFGFEVAHHIADKEGLFANIASHLAPDGVLLLADCASNTVAPVERPDVGSFTSPKADYALLLARHGLAVTDCIDVSREIGHFLDDPALDAMIAEETARGAGSAQALALMGNVQRSWHGFGEALRSGLMSYLLITARKRSPSAGLGHDNLRILGAA